MTFIVKAFSLNRENPWAFDPKDMGPMKGQIQLINGQKTEVNLQINEEQTRKIMSVLAESLVDTAKQAASLLVQQVIDQSGSIKLLSEEQ